MTEKELVRAMVAKNTFRSKTRDIEAIDYILDNLDDPKMHFRITNDSGVSIAIQNAELTFLRLRQEIEAEIEVNKAVLEKFGIKLECEEDENGTEI